MYSKKATHHGINEVEIKISQYIVPELSNRRIYRINMNTLSLNICDVIWETSRWQYSFRAKI